MISYPIDQIENDIIQSLKEKDFLIIKSSPGSGKTTRIPLFLIKHFKKKIYILEPRRLAAKLASEFVAKSLQTNVGEKVGHIFKYEKKVSDQTQIIFLTEGTFLRLLQDSKNLNGADVIILDEFHERHLTTDMAMGFLLELKKTYSHLKVIIMSATIDTHQIESLLKNEVKTFEVEQHRHPIQIHFLPNDTLVLKESLERKVVNAVAQSIDREGHILIFLPGMLEIRKCEEILRKKYDFEILLLHGDLAEKNLFSIDETFSQIQHKKIILSTNIAESSVTIPGVRIVIDSGLHRTNILHPITRMPQIEIKKIGQSSAIQRAYRSNREGPGLVFRLYPELDFKLRPLQDLPEIKRSDLSDLILKSYHLFHFSPSKLNFLDPIDEKELQKSELFLEKISFLKNQKLSDIAKKWGHLPYSPRILKILITAGHFDQETLDRVIDELSRWLEPQNTFKFKSNAKDFFRSSTHLKTAETEYIFLHGLIDQIVKIKNPQSYEVIHQNGEIYSISDKIHHTIDLHHPLWIILDLDNRNKISRMMPIEEEWIYHLDYFPIEEKQIFQFNHETYSLSRETITCIGAIVLERKKEGFSTINESTKTFLHKELYNDFLLLKNHSAITRLYLLEVESTQKIEQFSFSTWFDERLDYFQSGNTSFLTELIPLLSNDLIHYLDLPFALNIENDLPLMIELHDKRKIPINYDKFHGPSIESYIQDFFGMDSVPKILKGKLTLTISLLGPHKRALQVTSDLKSFWSKAYKEMLPGLKRDYPRHYWPHEPEKSRPILLLRNVPNSN